MRRSGSGGSSAKLAFRRDLANADQPQLRSRRHHVDKLREGSRHDLGVGIQKQHERGRDATKTDVVGVGEAAVLALEDADGRES